MLIRVNEELINIIHHYVVTRLAADEGIIYSGTITGCVDKVFSDLYGEKRYEGIEDRAGAILHSIVYGHSFADGNKRTGLLTTCLFLFFNGRILKIPNDCAEFLEKMADAKNPNAPTEIDAIEWVKTHTTSNILSSFVNILFTFYIRVRGLVFITEWTKEILARDILPYVDKEKLIDRKLLETRKQRWKDRTRNKEKRKSSSN